MPHSTVAFLRLGRVVDLDEVSNPPHLPELIKPQTRFTSEGQKKKLIVKPVYDFSSF